jgi:acetate CoA/acetoacetate CoA-transferase beta subunit
LNAKELIARRIANFFQDGDIVNLGAGLPVLIKDFLRKDITVIVQTENGIIGASTKDPDTPFDRYSTDASEMPIGIINGGSVVDSTMAFGIVRGGHLTATVLGTMQVDQEGSLANWMVPGGKCVGMGGAMDLVAGTKTVIVATEHCTKSGEPKILKKCTYPLTGYRVVSRIVTELAYFEINAEGLLLKELVSGITPEELRAKTEADFHVASDLKEMHI